MKKVAIFTIADNNNAETCRKFQTSLRKWHKEEEVDLLVCTEAEAKKFNDPKFYYRAKPILANQLVGQYEVIIGMDCDQVVCGDISELWADNDSDLMCVVNSNPKEVENIVVQVWDISPQEYMNAGLVVMRNPEFIKHWLSLCMSKHFYNYQYGEQDLLNILIHYGTYKTAVLDTGKNFYGLSSKGYWNNIELRDNKLFLPASPDGYPAQEKQIKVIHWAGGNSAKKMNFGPYFKEEVVEWLENLVK